MRRRRRTRITQGEVELNLAAMLDMAFQLLAFFILTFRPMSVEGHLLMRMPPPAPLTNVNAAADANSDLPSGASSSETLHMFVTADEQGRVAEIRVSNAVVFRGQLKERQLGELQQFMKKFFPADVTLFDSVQIWIDRRLLYEDVMKVIDVCTQQKLADGTQVRQISLVEHPRSANVAGPSD
jgi:biopolymer transport protein ExbD